MPQPYPDPNFNGTLEMMEYTNTVTGGWMVIGILIALYTIFLIGYMIKGYRTSTCFAISGAVSFIMGSLFWAAQLISGDVVLIFLLLFIAGVIWLVMDK